MKRSIARPRGFGLRQSSGAFAWSTVAKAVEDYRSPRRYRAHPTTQTNYGL